MAAAALEVLWQNGSGPLELVCCVSQPPARSGRRAELLPSPVHAWANARGLTVLTPESAKDPAFLLSLEELQPDLCVTAAYGQILNQRFLDIPKFGTLNIHPSLLPLYRGAAPVQRALQQGDVLTGVTLALTARAVDAGPVLAQKLWPLVGDEKAPDLLLTLFQQGAHLLLDCAEPYLRGHLRPVPQQHENATRAEKIDVSESWIDCKTTAKNIHNKVRAFAGWPGTRLRVMVPTDEAGGSATPVDIKVITTQLVGAPLGIPPQHLALQDERIYVGCTDGGVLEIKELQVPGKRVMGAAECLRGLWSRYVGQMLVIKEGGQSGGVD